MKMKTKKPNKLEEIYRMLPGNPIIYNSALKLIAGSVNAALLLSYLLFWQGKGTKGDWTYKTIEAIKKDIGLSRSNQDTAIGLLRQKYILEVQGRGIPRTRHFKVNIVKVTAIILSLQDSGKLARPEPTNSTAESKPTTPETTPEIKTYTKGNYLYDKNHRTTSGFEKMFKN